MKTFIGLKDFPAELPGLTKLEFFLSVTSITKYGAYLVSHMQLANFVQVRATITVA